MESTLKLTAKEAKLITEKSGRLDLSGNYTFKAIKNLILDAAKEGRFHITYPNNGSIDSLIEHQLLVEGFMVDMNYTDMIKISWQH